MTVGPEMTLGLANAYSDALDDNERLTARNYRLEQQLAEKDRELDYARRQLDEAALRNGDLTDALARSLGGPTW